MNRKQFTGSEIAKAVLSVLKQKRSFSDIPNSTGIPKETLPLC